MLHLNLDAVELETAAATRLILLPWGARELSSAQKGPNHWSLNLATVSLGLPLDIF